MLSSVHTFLLKEMFEINVTHLCLIVLICICMHQCVRTRDWDMLQWSWDWFLEEVLCQSFGKCFLVCDA